MPVADLKRLLVSFAGAMVVATVVMLIWDPTRKVTQGLYDLQQNAKTLSLTAPTHRQGLSAQSQSLAQNPIFIMTTGAMAYKEKSFKLFGVSITPKRKAALLSIEGQSAQWYEIGQGGTESRLIDIGTNGVRIETPVGTKEVRFTDAAEASTSSASSAAGG